MGLREYARKRDFAVTAEPAGDARRRTGGAPIFVIQLHHARARHFDFRLQVGDTLRSWAVPKGPSLRTQDKRLAVEVEDHPLSYADFHGEIPAGQYGGGHVRIADRGTWTPEGDPRKALAAGKLVFQLHGERLRGEWTLVRTARQQGGKPQWLLIKHRDAHVADTDLDTLLGSPQAGDAVAEPAQATSTLRESARGLAGARVGTAAAEPMLATLAEHAPDGDGWLHEIKWDGYRLLAAREHDGLHLQSRNGSDWRGRFPALEVALAALPAAGFRLDGELVVLDARGYSDFSALQQALEDGDDQALHYIAFDLLQLDDVDLTGVGLQERKALLQRLLGKARRSRLSYGEHIVGHGPRVAASSARKGFEGIVSKRIDAPYRGGRGRDWLKVKRHDGFDATVVGFTLPKGSRAGIGSLLLAVRAGRQWRYVGRVGSGLDQATLLDLRRRLDALATPAPVLDLPAHVPLSAKAVHWVRPALVVEVEHRGWGKEGLLRQAAFVRLRPDKSASARAPAAAGVRLTSPDRLVYPRPKISKQQVFDYYRAIAPWLLPEVAGRPLSVLRAPDGIGGEMFFQKHAGPGLGDAVRALPVAEKSGGRKDYLAIDDAAGLLQLVQMNALEFHPWGVRAGAPERPDRVVFDLDPAAGVDWKAIVAAAREIRRRLQAVGLQSFPLLSGGKGVHVVVPLGGSDGWDAVKSFARAVATVLAQEQPQRYVAVASKQARSGRIFIDWLRNGRGATSIAPWSLRARDGAPVAVPVRWEDLARQRGAAAFDLDGALRHARGLKAHPWGEYRALPQELPRSAGSL